MNRIQKALSGAGKDTQGKKLLSIYFSAGYPNLGDTLPILKKLQESGVDMVEIGLPFSDPLADGPTIQASSTKALENGMTTEVLFDQLAKVREEIEIPLLIMGYFNPMMQYGVEDFCKRCTEIGIDGLIIPDLPVDVYQENYKKTFEDHGLINVFLITPQTSDERVRYIDGISKGFIYMVSSASTTGAMDAFGKEQQDYFDRIESMDLQTPKIVGFGISNQQTFEQATSKTSGAIIGSAFVKYLQKEGVDKIGNFIRQIRP